MFGGLSNLMFSVLLHLFLTEDAGSSQDDIAAIPQGQREVILLVEDSDRIRDAAQRFLELLGYRVLAAANGQEAVAVHEAEKRVDLVVTDLVMPEMGGRELMRKLRTVAPGLKALAISRYAEEDLKDLGEDGFLDIVSKPFDVDILARAIRQVLHTG